MYIEPNTIVRILCDVPIDKTYRDTIYFSNRTSQYNYFSSLTKHKLTNLTYQRINRGVMRIQRTAEELYNCNYLMFQNASFGDRWFYAFITGVEYVSNVVSEIRYEIDVVQTWLLDCEINESFVEREHSTTDNIGDNILPESVELGEYVYKNQHVLTKALEPMAVIVAVTDIDGGVTEGELYDGVYSGVKYYCFNSNDTSTIDDFLSKFVQSPDSVVSMYMCPVIVCAEGAIESGTATVMDYSKTGWGGTIEISDNFTGAFGNYVPKNKKLYTYPYNFIHINNNAGNSLELRIEFFNGKPTLRLDSCSSMPVKITCRPYNYKGISGSDNSEVLSLDNYPMCSWNMDSYKVWLSQNLVPYRIKGASMVTRTMLSAGFATTPVGADLAMQHGINNSLGLVEDFATQAYSASIQADMCKGNINSGNVNIAHNMQNFYVSRCHISENYARYIDSFFTVFGYACRRVKKPNINSRPHWNYTKTIECNITGSIPSDDMAKLRSIFDNGVTFWKNGSEVGNYSLNNSP